MQFECVCNQHTKNNGATGCRTRSEGRVESICEAKASEEISLSGVVSDGRGLREDLVVDGILVTKLERKADDEIVESIEASNSSESENDRVVKEKVSIGITEFSTDGEGDRAIIPQVVEHDVDRSGDKRSDESPDLLEDEDLEVIEIRLTGENDEGVNLLGSLSASNEH